MKTRTTECGKELRQVDVIESKEIGYVTQDDHVVWLNPGSEKLSILLKVTQQSLEEGYERRLACLTDFRLNALPPMFPPLSSGDKTFCKQKIYNIWPYKETV